MAPAPPTAISLTILRRCRSSFPPSFACGAPAVDVMVAFSLVTASDVPARSCARMGPAQRIIADKARTGNGLCVAGSGGPILVRAACDPALDRRTDGGAGDEAGLPIVAYRPDDQHPAVAECVAGKNLRLVDQVFVVRHHGAVESGARRADT